MEKFGRTLLFVVFVIFLVKGADMASKVSEPYVRKFSPSLADALTT